MSVKRKGMIKVRLSFITKNMLTFEMKASMYRKVDFRAYCPTGAVGAVGTVIS